jgi:hypothetical protein
MRGLVRGWVPTLFGYSIQGAAKFGLYGACVCVLRGVFFSFEGGGGRGGGGARPGGGAATVCAGG